MIKTGRFGVCKQDTSEMHVLCRVMVLSKDRTTFPIIRNHIRVVIIMIPLRSNRS